MKVVTEIKSGSTFGGVVESMMKMVLATNEPCYVTMAGLTIVVFKDKPQIEIVQDIFGLDPKGSTASG